jgi:lipoate-protein ligase A
LLIDSDYGRLARYLTVSAGKLQAKGVASVRSRVINLRELKPDISVADMALTLENAFCERYAGNNQIIRSDDADYLEDPRLQYLYRHFASWSWRYGQSIKFDARIDRRFAWGHLDVGLVIEQGLIRQAAIYSDALDSDFIAVLASRLEGCRFQSAALVSALSGTPAQDICYGPSRVEMLEDLIRLIQEQNW